ncbi:MAG: ARMT1-like domain-containing protein [Methanomicrobiales archaeon]|nr:ARMT1-like domain-containing protein [Methanomicrobiales archaeon]
MKLDDRCFDCLLSRVAFECKLSAAGPFLTDETVRSCADLLSKIRNDPVSHPEIASAVHRHAYGMLNNTDPFKDLKEQSNVEALSVCNRVRPSLRNFRDLVLASIIGNTYDYGVKTHQVTKNFDEFFTTMFSRGLTIDDTDRILPLTKRVVYFTDNCGEIVFDRLLLEYLHANGSEITLVVRDAPILNDATMEEAEQFGLRDFVTTLTTTGCGTELGVRPDLCPPVLKEALGRCTLIISKGMANYESLSLEKDLPPVAYLMAVKCEPIADDIGVPKGSLVAKLCM